MFIDAYTRGGLGEVDYIPADYVSTTYLPPGYDLVRVGVDNGVPVWALVPIVSAPAPAPFYAPAPAPLYASAPASAPAPFYALAPAPAQRKTAQSVASNSSESSGIDPDPGGTSGFLNDSAVVDHVAGRGKLVVVGFGVLLLLLLSSDKKRGG